MPKAAVTAETGRAEGESRTKICPIRTADRPVRRFWLCMIAAASLLRPPLIGQDGLIPAFPLPATDIVLSRPSRPQTPFDKSGRRFAVFGLESGTFEAWAYPLKLLRDFEFSFLLGSSTVPILGRDVSRFITVDPARTTLTFISQSFTVKAHMITAIDLPGAVILLEVEADEPLTVVCSFLPVLQPMWPAGLGGQYASWDSGLKAYLISEPTRCNHGYVGSPAAEGISYTPAHMLADSPNQFMIRVADPGAVAGKFIPVVIAGGKGKREDIRRVYEGIAADPAGCFRAAAGHYENLRQSTLRVRTPVRDIDLALEWAKAALDNLVVDNPDLGLGLVAGLGPSGSGGRPGFGWFFGTDAYLNSLSLDSLGAFGSSREALAFTGKWQREDGKMAHELSQAAGYINWWKDYPYGFIHGDTTPYYIVAVGEYYRATGDVKFLKRSWPSLRRAFSWCLTTDVDGDGLMDNAKAGLGALEFGSLTGIQTDIYLAAVWARACRDMAELSRAVDDSPQKKEAEDRYGRALKAFKEKFWDGERGQYSYAFNREGGIVKELTPWSAVGLAWALGEPERSVDTLERMNSADLTTDWGVRMLSARSPLFEPLNYNYGAAWPFLTGWVSAALFEHGFPIQGYQALMSNVRHTFDNALGCVTELFSGRRNIWPGEAVPHQGFCSSGVVLPLVKGLLGLQGDSVRNTVSFKPSLPADWDRLDAENFKVGGRTVSVEYRREDKRIKVLVSSEKGSGYRFLFAPALGLGAEVRGATVNGRPVPVVMETPGFAQSIRPSVEFNLSGRDEAEIAFEPGPEVLPPANAAGTGDLDRGLKILRMKLEGKRLRIRVEGLAGETYALGLRHGEKVSSVSGAEFLADRLLIKFPPGPRGDFLGKEVALELK